MRRERVVRVGLLVLVAGALASVFAGYVVLTSAPGLVERIAEQPLADRCPDACETFVEEPGLFYLYGISSIGSLWGATRVVRHWRFDVGARSFVPRDRPLQVDDCFALLDRALGRDAEPRSTDGTDSCRGREPVVPGDDASDRRDDPLAWGDARSNPDDAHSDAGDTRSATDDARTRAGDGRPDTTDG